MYPPARDPLPAPDSCPARRCRRRALRGAGERRAGDPGCPFHHLRRRLGAHAGRRRGVARAAPDDRRVRPLRPILLRAVRRARLQLPARPHPRYRRQRRRVQRARAAGPAGHRRGAPVGVQPAVEQRQPRPLRLLRERDRGLQLPPPATAVRQDGRARRRHARALPRPALPGRDAQPGARARRPRGHRRAGPGERPLAPAARHRQVGDRAGGRHDEGRPRLHAAPDAGLVVARARHARRREPPADPDDHRLLRRRVARPVPGLPGAARRRRPPVRRRRPRRRARRARPARGRSRSAGTTATCAASRTASRTSRRSSSGWPTATART